MTTVQRLLPWLMAVISLALVVGAVVDRRIDSPYDWEAYGEIPVSASGRVKPLDTVARNTLMILSGRQTFEADGQRLPAIKWYADVLARPEQAGAYEVFRIDHPDLVALLGFGAPEGQSRLRFSFDELAPSFGEITRQAEMASVIDAKDRDPFQRQSLELYNRLAMYLEMMRAQSPYIVPPLHEGEEWRPLFDVAMDPALMQSPAPQAWQSIYVAYDDDDPEAFNEAVRAYRELIAPALPGAMKKAAWEVGFNESRPFYQAMILYVLAFLLAGAGVMLSSLAKPGWSASLWRSGMTVLIIAVLIHTAGLGMRIVLQGRPPVTNLYSSAVFVGWACVLLGIFLERLHKIGLAGMVSAIVGFATLVVAHNLATTGDTMEMMQAVLDSNFWLATHVIVITIGYSATFLAGALAIVYILLGVFTPMFRGETGKALPRMIYGVICFAALASFVGTVLGGIWADQSWGRFWGWDPKENGAALIVLMNLLILHARWGGMIRDRGVAVLAVGGNIITVWSWFGTNMLGVGLHSYGFIDSAVFWMMLFVVSQLVVMAIGLTPWPRWRSFSSRVASRNAAKPPTTARTALD